MWQGLKTICSSGNNPSAEVRADPSLAEELNIFYGRFDRIGGTTLPISASGSSRQSSDVDHVITVTEDEVRRELRRVNIRKAAGPDDDAISQVLHSSLTHIDSKNGNYVRLLFIDYSSAFNTIVPSKLAVKLSDLGLNTSLCDWIQDFLTGRPQVVKMGQFTSNSITLNVGAPQGCVLSPLLYSLYTHDCVSSHSSTSIVKFADDTVVLGLISNNDETAYLGEVERLTSWCQDNCLSLNVSKTKELIVDFRKRQQQPYTPLMISGTPVERVGSFKYLGVNISEDLTWTAHIQTQVKKARQRLYHLRQLRKFRVSPAILKTFYSGAIESVLTQCISVWYSNATNQDCKALQRVVRLAERISGSALPSLQDIYLKRCKSRAAKIIKDSNHPGNRLFITLPSGKRFRSVMAKN